MAYGLQVWDAAQNILVDTTDTILKDVAYVTPPGSSGTVQVAVPPGSTIVAQATSSGGNAGTINAVATHTGGNSIYYDARGGTGLRMNLFAY